MTQNAPLDELQWKSPEWIQAFGLRTDNVLEYFSQSPFFDRTSNNQVVKMQFQFNNNFQFHSANIENELRKMVGTEFVVLHRREPDFWVIRKQNRVNPDKVEPISDYYIIGANVYMAPSIKDVISTRLLSSALSLKNALRSMQTLSQFTPSDGHTYRYDSLIESNPPSSSRTLASTPYTPGTPTALQSNSVSNAASEKISIATMDNLFNISIKGHPSILDEYHTEAPQNNITTEPQAKLERPTTS